MDGGRGSEVGGRGWRLAALATLFCVVAFSSGCAPATDGGPFDPVIIGGRVMDPESGLDAVRSVGVRDGRIAVVSASPLDGAEAVDATGLVVAPGFIDLHAHGQDPVSSRYQARDGVTTALELEVGVFPVAPWYANRDGQALINYGASVSHQGARQRAMGSAVATSNDEGTFTLGETSDETLYRATTDEELAQLADLMRRGLDEGGLGFGSGLSYTPGASHREILELFGVAAAVDAPNHIHMRSSGDFRRGGALAPLQEVIANAAATGAAVHVVHLNSSAGDAVEEALAMIRGARDRGLEVTTEAYPYTASASLIESALFDGRVGQPDDSYRSLQWVETGERLTRESFDRYRETGGWVIMHGRSETTNEWVVSQPDVIAASDGIPFSEGRAHPRGAGTFARILGHYARDRGALPLMDALRKMTLLPARHLERFAPQMADKGRVRAGADADLTLFDPDRIIDRATYDAPDQYSEGIVHVLVGGIFVVRDGELVDGVTPGQAMRGRLSGDAQ